MSTWLTSRPSCSCLRQNPARESKGHRWPWIFLYSPSNNAIPSSGPLVMLLALRWPSIFIMHSQSYDSCNKKNPDIKQKKNVLITPISSLATHYCCMAPPRLILPYVVFFIFTYFKFKTRATMKALPLGPHWRRGTIATDYAGWFGAYKNRFSIYLHKVDSMATTGANWDAAVSLPRFRSRHLFRGKEMDGHFFHGFCPGRCWCGSSLWWKMVFFFERPILRFTKDKTDRTRWTKTRAQRFDGIQKNFWTLFMPRCCEKWKQQLEIKRGGVGLSGGGHYDGTGPSW